MSEYCRKYDWTELPRLFLNTSWQVHWYFEESVELPLPKSEQVSGIAVVIIVHLQTFDKVVSACGASIDIISTCPPREAEVVGPCHREQPRAFFLIKPSYTAFMH